MPNRPWTREEFILTLNLYFKIPFGKMNKSTEEVIQLAQLIGRTPSAIAMALGNFASVDPYHKGRNVMGLSHRNAKVETIWNEFVQNRDDLMFESELILAQRQNTTVEKKYSNVLEDIKPLTGSDKLRMIKVRVNQALFRQIVLVNYNYKCAVSGIDLIDILVASHIIPWSANISERLNPENGICLSPLYDKAFDRGLITFSDDYKLVLSKRLKSNESKDYYSKYFHPIEGIKMSTPSKYYPSKAFLEYHQENVFLKS